MMRILFRDIDLFPAIYVEKVAVCYGNRKSNPVWRRRILKRIC